jgi:DNA-binding LacI/PurR family transcriptional regulator
MPARGGSTIYSVAAHAGVSISTVSRYLNSPEKVNSETARRIKSSMDHLDYFPQGNAGTRVHRNIGRIGVLTPFFPAPSFVQRLQGMTGVFREAQCEMVVCTVDSPDQLAEYLHSLSFLRRFDGLIIMSMHVAGADALRLAASDLHVVMIESVNPMFTCVDADNVLGGRLAARCFMDKGYLPCAFVGEETSLPYSLQPSGMRLQGYREALEAAGLTLAPEHIRMGKVTVEDARRMAGELLDLPSPPRAIFAMSDLQAIGVLKAARQRGIAVPGRLAVLGFDDIEAADYMDLSTVSQSLAESGRVAAEILIDLIREPERPRRLVHMDVSVMERCTT